MMMVTLIAWERDDSDNDNDGCSQAICIQVSMDLCLVSSKNHPHILQGP